MVTVMTGPMGNDDDDDDDDDRSTFSVA